MEISNEVKAKVFAMYLGQEILIIGNKNSEQFHSLSLRGNEYLQERHHINDGKLILRTVDQLIDEELNEVEAIAGIMYASNIVNAIKGKFKYQIGLQASFNVYQYLLSIGIDLPSIHLGGKTLIESGLAIKKEVINEKHSTCVVCGNNYKNPNNDSDTCYGCREPQFK